MNGNQPLWLPPGSVRAIIALVLVGVLSVLALNGKVEAVAFLTIVTAVVTFYFGAKANQAK